MIGKTPGRTPANENEPEDLLIEEELARSDSGPPTVREIAEQDAYLLRRQAEFRLAADAVAKAFAAFPEVAAVALFGSVALPLEREVPRFREYRRAGMEVWHECKDVDLAVWIERVDNLEALAKAERRAVQRLHDETGIGVAHHQVDTFLIEPGSNRYLGRLCWYNHCPKGKEDCLAPGCGHSKFLKQHREFKLYPDALAEGRLIRLYDRATGTLRKAPPVPGATKPAG
ncbi:MAG TPA: hypothetical protein VFG64_19820 [Dongiaceae bacterium]|nr:hypothetical protein [Dongiaceae bacterium]